jgi:hypothetical protein
VEAGIFLNNDWKDASILLLAKEDRRMKEER